MKVAQLCPALWDPIDYTVHGILQARILDWVAFPSLQGIFPTQGWNPSLLHCRKILFFFFPTEPHGNSKNARVGGLSLLQGIFPTQESNQTGVSCIADGWIPYQLSYQGSKPLDSRTNRSKSLLTPTAAPILPLLLTQPVNTCRCDLGESKGSSVQVIQNLISWTSVQFMWRSVGTSVFCFISIAH